MSTPTEGTSKRGARGGRPEPTPDPTVPAEFTDPGMPPTRPGPPGRPDRPDRFRGDVPEGFDMSQRMGRITLLSCGTCGAAVVPETTAMHAAWHDQQAALLPPAEGGAV